MQLLEHENRKLSNIVLQKNETPSVMAKKKCDMPLLEQDTFCFMIHINLSLHGQI